MKQPFTYEVAGSGVGNDGWFKYTLVRSDGRRVRVTPKRLAELSRANRITEASGARKPFI